MEPKTELYNFRASKALIREITKQSKRLDIPVSQFIREALKDRLERLKTPAKNNA